MYQLIIKQSLTSPQWGGGKLYSVKEQSTMSIYLKVQANDLTGDLPFDGVTVLDEYYSFGKDGLCVVEVPDGTYSFKLHKSGKHITRSSTSLTNGAGTSRNPYIISPRIPVETWEAD